MKVVRKILRILSIISYVIIIVYGLVNAPKLFGLNKLIIDSNNSNGFYSKDSIVYYYKTNLKSIGAGDIITYEEDGKLLSGSVSGISGNEYILKINGSEKRVLDKNIQGKNINIVVKYLGPYVAFMDNNLVLSLAVLITIILIYIIFGKKKDKVKDGDNHKKVLEIDE